MGRGVLVGGRGVGLGLAVVRSVAGGKRFVGGSTTTTVVLLLLLLLLLASTAIVRGARGPIGRPSCSSVVGRRPSGIATSSTRTPSILGCRGTMGGCGRLGPLVLPIAPSISYRNST